MGRIDAAKRIEQVLGELSGQAIDWSRWPNDSVTCEWAIATISRLWQLGDLSALPPASTFSAAWDGDSYSTPRDTGKTEAATVGAAEGTRSTQPFANAESCAAAVRSGEVSAREAAEWSVSQISRDEPHVQAFSDLAVQQIFLQADGIDAKRKRQRLGVLAGVPIGVKDLIDVKGLHTSYGSQAFEPFVAQRDAHVVACLRSADALIIGKTRTSEFAWLLTTPPTTNPRNPDILVGGSSGGSAAAVAARLVLGALGTDTGGSIRIPSALCGIAGLKPTFGLISRTGVLPANFSLDHVGPMAQSVADIRLMLQCSISHDATDPNSAPDDLVRRVATGLRRGQNSGTLKGSRLGVLQGPLFEVSDREMKDHHQDVLSHLAQAGAELIDIDVPDAEFIPAVAMAIDLGEGAAIHTERLRDHADAFGPEVRRLLHFAHAIPAVALARGHQGRRHIIWCIAEAFKANRLDALIAPAMPSSEVHVGKSETTGDGRRKPELAGYSQVNWLANLTGQPAIVVSIGSSENPFAIQLVGRPFADHSLLNLAQSIEQEFVAESA